MLCIFPQDHGGLTCHIRDAPSAIGQDDDELGEDQPEEYAAQDQLAEGGTLTRMKITDTDAADELAEAGTGEHTVPQKGHGEHLNNPEQEGDALEHLKAGGDQIGKIEGGPRGQKEHTHDENEIPVDQTCDDAANDDLFVHEIYLLTGFT